MKPGPKPRGAAEKRRRGTFEPGRHAGQLEPQILELAPLAPPDWLTSEGGQIWARDSALAARYVSDLDTSMFANYCNLLGAITKCWQSGDTPPGAYIAECRRMAEQFGLFGWKSRAPAAPGARPGAGNPFAGRNRRGHPGP